MRNSRVTLLLFLFLVGTVLYYRAKSNPWQSFKHDVYHTFGIKDEEKNLFDIKEHDTVATDDHTQKGQATGNQTESENSLDKYLPAYDSDAIIIRHKPYILRYEEKYEQASWVVHKLLDKAKYGTADRSNNFQPDPEVETGTALPNDYSRSGYDRGHLCPAGDFRFDKDLEDETFYMSNMSPQEPDFNRGIWSNLELKARDWAAERGYVIVVTGPVLKDGLETIGKKNAISVPKQYYKIIYDPEKQEAIAFLMKNEGSYDSLQNFVVSIDALERLTGINFFAKLPDAIEKKIESESSIGKWF
jgi:endonuclease G, mitochondrial